MDIRKMEVKDIDDIMSIENCSFSIPWSKESYLNEIKNNVAIYIVAVFEKHIIGYAGVWKIIDEGHITNIAVHPDHRQRGVGQKLMQELIKISKKEGIKNFTLEVRESNIAAFNLYEKMGFRAKGRRKGYYSNTKEDAVIMWKEHSS